MIRFQWVRKIYRNPFLGKIRRFFFHIFNFFYLPHLYFVYQSKLKNVPSDTQLFLMTRGDFGTLLVLLNYIRCWEEKRGKTALVILTHHFVEAAQLTKIISPNTMIISPDRVLDRLSIFLFGSLRIHFHALARIYARLTVDYPNALYIYPQPSTPRTKAHYSPYIPFFDKALKQIDSNSSKDFVDAYKKTRYILDYHLHLYLDMVDLYYHTDFSTPHPFAPKKSESLKRSLSIEEPYVVINVNCKDNLISHNRKKIVHPERFDVLIDQLIQSGYSVVIQGRKEQHAFQKRKGLIDYSKSPYCSAENDLLLYEGCSFAIMTKSGPENFAPLCNVPLLGLNYVELPSMQPNLKTRFYPKQIWDRKKERYLSWKEILSSPIYFDIGYMKFDANVEYREMEIEELLDSLKEFLELLPNGSWESYTPMQQAFKNALSPLHLDLYYIKGVPCHSYLSSTKFN